MCLSALVYAANKVYHPTVTQPFGASSPEQHLTATRGSCGQEKSQKPLWLQAARISGIQDLVVLQNSQLTVRNQFHLVQKQTESPGGCNPKSIPPSTWD